jgi:hypothetical protein
MAPIVVNAVLAKKCRFLFAELTSQGCNSLQNIGNQFFKFSTIHRESEKYYRKMLLCKCIMLYLCKYIVFAHVVVPKICGTYINSFLNVHSPVKIQVLLTIFCSCTVCTLNNVQMYNVHA